MTKTSNRNTNREKKPFIQKVGSIAKDLATTAGRTAVSEVARWGVKALISAVNHPDWYTKYPLTGIINANFGVRRGRTDTYFAPASATKTPLSSVAVLHTELMYEGSFESDVMQAVQLFYSKLRAANFGAVNYTASQVGCYIYTVREIHALYAYAYKLVSALNNVSPYDTSVPEAMVTVNQITYSALMAESANIRMQLNVLGRQIQASCPLSVTLIDRVRWIFANYFKDSSDVKSALYHFALDKVVVFKTDGTINKTYTIKTVAQIITALNEIMSTFSSIDLYSVIAGDMVRAFGEKAFYTNFIIDETSQANLVHDEFVLNQINNICFFPNLSNQTTYSASTSGLPVKVVKQNTMWYNTKASPVEAWGSINATKKNHVPYNVVQNYVYVNSAKNNVSPAQLLSLTRFSNLFEYDQLTENIQYAVYGTEIVTSADIVYRDESGTLTSESITGLTGSYYVMTPPGVTSQTYGAKSLALTSQIDWFPMLTRVVVNKSVTFTANGVQSTGDVTFYPIWDFRNYAKVQDVDLSAYHNYALLSLMAPPDVSDLSKFGSVVNSKGNLK